MRHRARLVLGWGTAQEVLRVLSAFAIVIMAALPSVVEPKTKERVKSDLYPVCAGAVDRPGSHWGAVSFCQGDDCGFAKCFHAKDKRDGMVRPVRILIADSHTVSHAPDLFRPPKLSGTGPG